MRRSRSLRLRLTAWFGAVLAVCLALYAVVVYGVLARHIRSELDLDLHEEVEIAAGRVEAPEGAPLAWRGGSGLTPAEEEPEGARWIEVWSREGLRLLSGTSGAAERLGPLPPWTPGDGKGPDSLTLPAGVHVRSLAKGAVVGGRALVVRAARSEEPARAQLRQLLVGLALALPAVLAVFGLSGYVLVGRMLAPIARMAERSRRITAHHLAERLPVEDPDDELGQLATAFNDTFARLERSFEQLHRFTADASHELRTPLTALRSVGEVGLQRVRDLAESREVIGSMLEEADRLTRLVDTLLFLARADAGEVTLAPEELDLGELARDVCATLSVLAEDRSQSVSVQTELGVSVCGDRVVLRQAITNLVDNAIKYGPAGAPVEVRVGRSGEGIFLEVSDRGPGIPESHRQRIFDRFHRVDRDRSRDTGGAGLGLSIVNWVAAAHEARVEVEDREGGGSTFRLRFGDRAASAIEARSGSAG